MIIGLSGFIGSGKDTVASYLHDKHDYWKLAFADSLKDITASLFGWDRDVVEGSTRESRALREVVDAGWTERLGKVWSPRIALQYIGTEMFREKLHPDFWLLVLERKIVSSRMKNIVISDVRFENEMEMIRKHGGQIWRIQREETDPDWAYGNEHHSREAFIRKMVMKGIHESEWNSIQPGVVYDKVLDNDSSLEVLYEKVEDALS